MPYIYNQKTGEISRNGTPLGNGYSGKADGRNNPDAERKQGIGPLPAGYYLIGKAFDDMRHPGKGPCVMRLYPVKDTNEFGRSGFMIHGNNATNDASDGCIILAPSIRRQIADGDDRDLEVIHGVAGEFSV